MISCGRPYNPRDIDDAVAMLQALAGNLDHRMNGIRTWELDNCYRQLRHMARGILREVPKSVNPDGSDEKKT